METGNFFENEIISSNYKFNSFVVPFYDSNEIFSNKKSGYIDFYKNYLVLAFTSGKIIFVNKKKMYQNNFEFFEVKNNLKDNFFNQKIIWTGIKDIKVIGDFIYVSLTKEVKQGCYNTSLFKAELNTINLIFKEVFSPDECFEVAKQIQAFKYFNGAQSGGRIVNNDESIFLTLGDYNYWERVQKLDSFAGKILKLDIYSNEYEILSVGHRNPQGLYYLKEYNHLISTEHGPKGGDEINLIKINSSNIQNFGWPISSYGYHYDVVPLNSYVKKVAPLEKNHTKYGFIEPKKYFINSIGISEIIKNPFKKDSFLIASLKEMTLFDISFDNQFNFQRINEKININERIRDLGFDNENNCVFLYGETSPKLLLMCKK